MKSEKQFRPDTTIFACYQCQKISRNKKGQEISWINFQHGEREKKSSHGTSNQFWTFCGPWLRSSFLFKEIKNIYGWSWERMVVLEMLFSQSLLKRLTVSLYLKIPGILELNKENLSGLQILPRMGSKNLQEKLRLPSFPKSLLWTLTSNMFPKVNPQLLNFIQVLFASRFREFMICECLMRSTYIPKGFCSRRGRA